jgi:hypothetical protein
VLCVVVVLAFAGVWGATVGAAWASATVDPLSASAVSNDLVPKFMKYLRFYKKLGGTTKKSVAGRKRLGESFKVSDG